MCCIFFIVSLHVVLITPMYKLLINHTLKTAMLIFLLSIISIVGFGQEQHVSIRVKNASLKEILKNIEKQTSYRFSYRNSILDNRKNITVSEVNVPVSVVLNIATQNRNLSYKIISPKMIVIVESKRDNPLEEKSLHISGLVREVTGEPILGATILEKGTANGTITDIDGRFSLELTNNNAVIECRYVGCQNVEIPVTNKKQLTITMAQISRLLDEVVVVAYGTQKRRDVIGSVSKIREKDLNTPVGGQFQNAIQGKVTGVQVVNDGIVGDDPQIKIRGIHSISSETDPLWVVDGMIDGDASRLNYHDIASIEILKDAAATAIYGSRGSNGVIIVTTKHGRKGIPQIVLNCEYGVTQLTKKSLGMASTEEYFKVMDLGRYNRGLTAFDPQRDVVTPFWTNCDTPITREEALAVNNDYTDMATRTGHYDDVNLSITQGGENTQNYISVNYRNDIANLIGRDQKSYAARINSDYSKGLFSIGLQVYGEYKVKNQIEYWKSVPLVPWYKIYDSTSATGYWNPRMGNEQTGQNPMALLDPDFMKNEHRFFNGRLNAYLEVKIPYLSGASIRADASYAIGTFQYNQWTSEQITRNAILEGNSGTSSKNTTYNQQYHLYGKYRHTFNAHSLNAVMGLEINREYTDYLTISGQNLSGAFQEMKIVGTYYSNTSGFIGRENYLMNFFGRADYKYKDKYLLSSSMVQEGSSKFTKENRWANFYSVSAGWILSNESFMNQCNWISLLKLRGSYGETGNQNIPSEATITSYATKSEHYYNGETNMYLWNLHNTDAKWEKTKSLDVGIDYGFFENRINGSIAYYRQNVDNMLLKVQLPASAGIPDVNFNAAFNNSIWANVGSMYNEGLEFDLDYQLIYKNNFSWDAKFNLSYNHNQVTALSPDVDIKGTGIINTRPGVITKKGSIIGTYYIAEWAGVDPEKGIGTIYELDKAEYERTGRTVRTGKIIPATVSNIVKNRFIEEGKSGMPKFIGSWTNSFTYQRFDLSLMLYMSLGNYIYDRFKDRYTKTQDGRANIFSGRLEDSWTKAGDSSEYPEIRWGDVFNYNDDGTAGSANYGITEVGTTQFLENASFLRLRNLTVGYSFSPQFCQKLQMRSMRVYLSATNLFTITDFKGWDPEIKYSNKNGANAQGVVFIGDEMPQIRSFAMGLKVAF